MNSSSPDPAHAKWIILDRDGVINADSDAFIKSPEEWQPLAGSLEAIARLNNAGYQVVVISNQSGIARGLFDLDTLGAIHQKLRLSVQAHGGEIKHLYFCPHQNEDECDCRKPKPGLFHQAALELGFSLDGVLAVGDSVRDLQAAKAAGASPVLLKTGKGPRSLKFIADLADKHWLKTVPLAVDLAAFTDALLSKQPLATVAESLQYS